MGQGASGKEVERWWYLSSTCAFGWEEEAGIYLKKGDPCKSSQDTVPKGMCEREKKGPNGQSMGGAAYRAERIWPAQLSPG